MPAPSREQAARQHASTSQTPLSQRTARNRPALGDLRRRRDRPPVGPLSMIDPVLLDGPLLHVDGVASHLNVISEFHKARILASYGAEQRQRLSQDQGQVRSTDLFHLNTNTRPPRPNSSADIGCSARRTTRRPTRLTKHLIGDQDAHALEHRSRCVTIAGCGPRAGSGLEVVCRRRCGASARRRSCQTVAGLVPRLVRLARILNVTAAARRLNPRRTARRQAWAVLLAAGSARAGAMPFPRG